MPLLCSLFALCFNKICENAEKKVPANINNIKILLIFLHHQYSDENDQHSQKIVPGERLLKNQHSPELGPDQINTAVGVCRGEIKVLDDLLPGKGIDAAVCHHQKEKQIEHPSAKPVGIILDRSKL